MRTVKKHSVAANTTSANIGYKAQLIDLTSNNKVGDEASSAKDGLGRVYGSYCGSSGMFVQSVEFIRAHGNGGERLQGDKRWHYGAPPMGNANFAWVQHIVHHLAPAGVAGFVLANGSMSSNQSGAGEIRKSLIEADLVDCMVALPGQLFHSTQVPACLWFLAKGKHPSVIRREGWIATDHRAGAANFGSLPIGLEQ